MKRAGNPRRGFTLIEMVVVIMMIAALIALVAPVLVRYLDTARQTSADAAAKSLYTAASAWLAEERVEPHPPVNGANLDETGTGEFVKKLSGEAGPLDGYIQGGRPETYTVRCINGSAVFAECVLPDGTRGSYGEAPGR